MFRIRKTLRIVCFFEKTTAYFSTGKIVVYDLIYPGNNH